MVAKSPPGIMFLAVCNTFASLKLLLSGSLSLLEKERDTAFKGWLKSAVVNQHFKCAGSTAQPICVVKKKAYFFRNFLGSAFKIDSKTTSMTWKTSFYAVLLFSLASCSPTPKPAEPVTEELPTVAFTTFLESYYEEYLKFHPMEATYQGDHRYNDQLPNTISRAYRQELKAFFSKYLEQLKDYNKEELSPSEAASWDILKWECEIHLDELQYKTHLIPMNQFSCLPLEISQQAGGSGAQPFYTKRDYENWLDRVGDFEAWCDTAITNMRRGMELGYVLPAPLAQKMVPQLIELSSGPVEEHVFFTPATQFPDGIPQREQAELEMAYAGMVNDKVIPAFDRLRVFFENEYLPVCRETHGVADIPEGKAYYNHQIKKYTTTDMTADEIFELGQKEVVRLLGEMEKVKTQVGYEGDIISFFDYVRNKKELMPYTDPQQVIDNFNAIHERMKPQLAKLFDLSPKTPFEVRRTEAFREATGSAEYNPGSKDGSRPGIFYVPIPNVEAYNVYADEDLFLHEAIPGHHYQISISQEDESLPTFRQSLWYSSYGEGWALYCESLGEELGLYTDPYQYFGMLSAEMHRAIRLVVDVGMHVKGWTREEAIQYSLENEAEPEESIIAEIERYMAWPGQALSYKIGQLKIITLKEKAQQELGEQFDIKKFHNTVLSSGCVPLSVLEQMVNNWIAQEKALAS